MSKHEDYKKNISTTRDKNVRAKFYEIEDNRLPFKIKYGVSILASTS